MKVNEVHLFLINSSTRTVSQGNLGYADLRTAFETDDDVADDDGGIKC